MNATRAAKISGVVVVIVIVLAIFVLPCFTLFIPTEVKVKVLWVYQDGNLWRTMLECQDGHRRVMYGRMGKEGEEFIAHLDWCGDLRP